MAGLFLRDYLVRAEGALLILEPLSKQTPSQPTNQEPT